MPIKKFDHIAIVVDDLDAAVEHFSTMFDFDDAAIITYRDYKDTDPDSGAADILHFFLAPVGEVYLELIEPVKPDGPMMRFLQRTGGGFHHVGITSCNVAEEWRKHAGDRDHFGTIEHRPRVDQYDVSYWFLHPKKNFGALWEVDAAWAKTSASDMTPIEPTPDWDSILGES